MDPNDRFHLGKGGLQVFNDRVDINAAFEVPPGPKYHVYLMQDNEVTCTNQVNPNRFISLGRLCHFTGTQSY